MLNNCHFGHYDYESGMLYPYHFRLIFVIFFVAGATFADPVTRSFVIVSFVLTPHIHRSMFIAFTSRLFS